MNSHSISLVLRHPLPDLKVSLLNPNLTNNVCSEKKKKKGKERQKNPDIGVVQNIRNQPISCCLSNLGFIHLNFPAAKGNFLARLLAAISLKASAYEMTRSPWSALKINIHMVHKQIIIIRIKLLIKHSCKSIFSWSHELIIVNITSHKTISKLISLTFPGSASCRWQLPTLPAKLQRGDFLHPNHF